MKTFSFSNRKQREIDTTIIPPSFLLNILSPGVDSLGQEIHPMSSYDRGQRHNVILILTATTFLEIGKYLSLQGLCAGKRREAAKEKKLFSLPPLSDNRREMAGGRKTKSTSPALHNSVSLPRFEIPGKRQGNIFCTAT